MLSEIGSRLTEKYVNKGTFRTREQTSQPHYFLTHKMAKEMPTRKIFLAMPLRACSLKPADQFGSFVNTFGQSFSAPS